MSDPPKPAKKILGVEGGGTKTDWVVCIETEGNLEVVDKGQLPASNFRLISTDALRNMFSLLPSDVTHAGMYLAGCVTEEDRHSLLKLCRKVWPNTQITAGSDRDSSLAAAFGNGDGIAVISGTGSAVTGRKGSRIEKAGGRGHLLGDKGGAYFICLEGLRLALRQYDLEHRTILLAENILRALALNHMEELINWSQSADKFSISSLAPVLFETAQQGDARMQENIEDGAVALAQYTTSVARWLDFSSAPVRLSGGMFMNQPYYVELFKKALSSMYQAESVEVCWITGAYGAAFLASGIYSAEAGGTPAPQTELEVASTEQSNPRSRNLEKKSISELVDLFINEERFVAEALR